MPTVLHHDLDHEDFFIRLLGEEPAPPPPPLLANEELFAQMRGGPALEPHPQPDVAVEEDFLRELRRIDHQANHPPQLAVVDKEFKLDKAKLNEAGKYARNYLRKRRFLREIQHEDGTLEFRLFDKRRTDDPDVIDLVVSDGTIKSHTLKPFDVLIVDKANKRLYRQQPNKPVNQTYPVFTMFVQRGWEAINMVKRLAMAMIEGWLEKHQPGYKTHLRHNCVDKIAGEAIKSIRMCYRLTVQAMRRVLGGRLWKALDKEALHYMVRMCGNKASSLDYMLVWNNLEEVKDTFQKAPGILPVWRIICLRKMWKTIGNFKNAYTCDWRFPDILRTTKDFLEKNPTIVLTENTYAEAINNYNDAQDYGAIGPDNARFTHQRAKNADELTSQGWRYLINLKPAWTRRMMHLQLTVGMFNEFLDFWADIRTIPRYTLTKRLYRDVHWMTPNDSLMGLLRACFDAAQKSKAIRLFWDQQASLVLDWYNQEYNRHGRHFDSNQRKQPWSWFMRQQAEWHERIQRAEKEKLAKEFWESLLAPFEYKGYLVAPLTSSLALFDEGKEMRHCVSSYCNQCKTGSSQIFSIRDKEDHRIATVEIRRGGGTVLGMDLKSHRGKWEMNQVRGHCNATVPVAVEAVAKHIAVLYNRAEAEEDHEIRSDAV